MEGKRITVKAPPLAPFGDTRTGSVDKALSLMSRSTLSCNPRLGIHVDPNLAIPSSALNGSAGQAPAYFREIFGAVAAFVRSS